MLIGGILYIVVYISVSKYLRGVYGKVMDIVLFSADLSAELARLLFPD